MIFVTVRLHVWCKDVMLYATMLEKESVFTEIQGTKTIIKIHSGLFSSKYKWMTSYSVDTNVEKGAVYYKVSR